MTIRDEPLHKIESVSNDSGMESTEPPPLDESLDSNNIENNIETAESNILVLDDDFGTEVFTSQAEEDQGEQEILGYLEIDQSTGETRATINLNAGELHLNGQRLILHQNDENQIFVLLADSSLEQIQSVSQLPMGSVYANALKENGTVIVDNASEALGFIQTEEVSQSQEERQLACIARKISSSERHNDNTETSNEKYPDCLLPEAETSVIVTQKQVEQDSDLTLTSTEVESSESIETVHNIVSVIHTTSSELQDSLENQITQSAECDLSSVEDFSSAYNENELPSDLMDSNESKVSLQDDLGKIETKDIEEDDLSRV